MNTSPVTSNVTVLTRAIPVVNRLGLHARPSVMLATLISRYHSKIRVSTSEQSADPRSVMSLLLLAADRGTTLIFTAQGKDAAALLEAIERLFASGFDEPN